MDKTLAALLTMLVLAGAATAAIYIQYNNQTVTLIGDFEAYFNNQRLYNTSIGNMNQTGNWTVNWGTVNRGTTVTRSLSVRNTDNQTCLYTLYVTDLPHGWIETWSANNTSASPNQWTNGTLALTTPSNATKTTYLFGKWLLIATGSMQ